MYVWKRKEFLLLRLFVKIFFLFFTIGGAMILPLRYLVVYGTYQQGACTIADKQVEYISSDRNSTNPYHPFFSYLVHPLSGGQVSATGFDGPTSVGYGTYYDAQTVADRYQVGETTSCWYDPTEPNKAFIVFYGYGTMDEMVTFCLGLLGFGGLAILVYLISDLTVWRLYALWKRGVLTQGTVLSNEERRNRDGRYMVSIIGFCVLEQPAKEWEIILGRVLNVGSRVLVCYDPLYPRYRWLGEWPYRKDCLPGLLGIAILLIIAFFVMYNRWLVP